MSETSGGAWKCVHCPLTMIGLPPGANLFEVCPSCHKPQHFPSTKETKTVTEANKPPDTTHDPVIPEECNNAECKSKLFNQAATKECESCSTNRRSINPDTDSHMSSQDDDHSSGKQKQQSSERQGSSSEDPELCSNNKCESGLYSEAAIVECSGCSATNEGSAEGRSTTDPQHPIKTSDGESMDVSPPASDTTLQSLKEVKNVAGDSDQTPPIPTNTQKELQQTAGSSGSGFEFQPSHSDSGTVKPRSATPGPLECVNQDCKEPLFPGSSEFCHKCQTQQSDSKLTVSKEKQTIGAQKGDTETSSHHSTTDTPMEIIKKDSPKDKPNSKDSSVDPVSGIDSMDISDSLKDSPLQAESGPDLVQTHDDPLTRPSLGTSRDRSRKRPNGSNEHVNKFSKLGGDGEQESPVVGEGRNPPPQSYAAAASKNGETGEPRQPYRKAAYSRQDEYLPGTRSQHQKEPVATGSGYDLRSRENLSGLNPSDPDKTFTVTFHVLVPLEAWSWDGNTRMHMRFGHPKLGQWKLDVGSFDKKGNVREGLAEMQCSLKLDIDIFLSQRKPIPYKYVIHSHQRMQSDESSKAIFECFHDCPNWFGSGIINRSLDIPKHQCTPQGMHHQFDNMTFPHVKSESKHVVTRVWEGIKGLVRSSDKKTDSLRVPSHDSMQKKCLEIYLEHHRKVLCECDLSPQFNILTATDGILLIYNQLYCQKIESSHGLQRDWKSNNLAEGLRDWLFEIIKDLSSKKCSSPHDNGRRMASVLCVANSLYSVVPNPLPWHKLDLDIIEDLISMLILCPGIEGQQCLDLNVLLSLLPRSNKEETADAVRSFCTQLSYNKLLKSPQWLCAIPLVHFLREKTIPFDNPQLALESIVWNDRQFGLTHVKTKCSNMNLSLVKEHFHELEPLVELDPLLLPIVVFVCPNSELSSLFLKIPPYLSATRVSVIVNQTKGNLNKNEIAEVSQLIRAILEVTKSLPEKEAKRGYGILEASLNASQLLLSRLTSKLHGPNTDAVKLVISTLFYSAKNLQLACVSDAEKHRARECCDILFKRIISCFESWIRTNFSAIFGSPDYKKFTLAKTELQMWLSLIDLDCPQEFLTKWHDMVQQMIKSRVVKVPFSMRIDLLCILESQQTMQNLITNVFVEAAMQALEKMGSQDQSASVQRLYGALYQQRATVGKILERILRKKYPHDPELITLDQLLDWELWPIYINVYKSEALMTQEVGDRVHSCLPEWCAIVCTCADSTLDGICKQLQTGVVTLEELKKISKKSDQMEALCAAHIHKTDTHHEQKTAAMKHVLQLRIQEQKRFSQTKELLGFLCGRIPESVKVLGLDELRRQLKANYLSTPIKELCPRNDVNSNPHPECCFMSAAPICSIIEKFDVIARRLQSELFAKIWQDTLKKASKTVTELAIPHIVTEMWHPAIAACGTLLESIHDCTIKLSVVDNHFKEHCKDKERIIVHLHNLFNGIQFSHDKSQEKGCPRWITAAVDLMQQYWTLQQNAEAAVTVLDLKEKLNLTGDFSLVETLAHKMTTSMRDQTLAAVDARLIDAGEFLSELLADKNRLTCLKTFANCMDIVNWIRKETEEVKRLHNFVSLALHTAAGEGDFASDSLSHLKTIGFGYGPLIYGLKKNTSFDSFRQQCRAVWETLKEQPNLPQLLLSCNGELDYYKNVKQTQASVEVTSFGQMKNIHSFGSYKIGSNRAEILQNIDDVIHMTLTERGKKRLVHTSYSLNELRDLESKLVLITGSNAENRAEVDHYLDTLHGVCRIADVLIALQQVGNVQYIGWVLEVPCRGRNVSELQEQAKSMEHELEKWKQELKNMREEFYELNYYTTLQLLILRRELGQIKSQPSAVLKPEVVTLLKSISLEISPVSAPQLVRSVIPTAANQTLPSDSEITELSPKASVDERSNIESSHAMESLVIQNRPSISKEVLASADVQVSMDITQKHDEPKLSVESLTDEQAEIMAYCQDKLQYSQVLVLKAFEECGQDAVPYDIQNWCGENAEKYHHLEQTPETDYDDTMSDDDDEEPMSDSSSEADTEVFPPGRAVRHDHPMAVSVPSSTPGIVQIEVAQKPLVDKYNPVVIELVSAGFGVEQSIAAVKRYETLDAAMEYLMSADDSEEAGLFHASDYEVQPADDRSRNEHWDVSTSTPTIKCDSRTAESFLSLVELGKILKELRKHLPQAILMQRTFNTRVLKAGSPNLLVTSSDGVLRTTLALYMEEETLPLPTPEEVLVCNPSTTTEEVNLLWMRAIKDGPEFRRIFCLVHAEKLSYQVCDNTLRSLSEYSQGQSEYRLVIICSNEDEEKSHLISKLDNCRKQYVPKFENDQYRQYLMRHFTGQVEAVYAQQTTSYSPAKASAVDHEISRVRVVSSTRSGMGKTLRIKRMGEQLRLNLNQEREHLVTIPLHGPVVTPDRVLDFLKEHMEDPECTIYHFDIAPNVLREVDAILFSLLILSGLTDSKGRVWRCHPSQMYAVEVTLPEKQTNPQAGDRSVPEARTLALLNLLPTVTCVSPFESMMLMNQNQTRPDLSRVLMDSAEFESPMYQRVYQYLRRHIIGGNHLDTFSYAGNVEGTPENCLEVITSKCGVRDPSWSEVRHFVEFFNLQLQSCEDSVFCDETFVGDVMSGLKGFVVKFMIRMSRDFATSSMKGEVARENMEEQAGDDLLEQYEIHERRLWEQNSHPYIFFNQDRVSITFVGFKVTKAGDLVEPAGGGVLERGIMTQQLYTGLVQNRVNFEDDYRNWHKGVMIEKIATVMGIEFPHDPDETYVLTVDNLIKMLAIQMRFRCGIPVVIMGETGCGKTRLIRYMCDLARQGYDRNNMLILKVHGGTTEKDIINFVDSATKEAIQNRQQQNMDTVVFFDEANTTDAIGLIKEIMCDGRLNGKPVSKDLKFIAACNPYRKHTEDMIEKLEAAGLGFAVKTTETLEKLGKIPLRQLVYRVLDLPPSMRPLVYDFGQLNTGAERDYVAQIVNEHVKGHPLLSQENPQIIPVIISVLTWSQAHMRGRKDECSFVSLRDVERAMIVFEYFYEKMDVFAPLMDDWITKLQHQDEEEDDQLMEVDALPPRPVPNNITRALILSVSVCYHARLHERQEYEEGVSRQFVPPLALPGRAQQFRNEIKYCQEVLLDNMCLGENIARNAALRENVFMMAICIELRIPLFLVGKPGSSKSLAKTIIHDSMRGRVSQSDLLKGFKEVTMLSYQCSQLSTPESVIEVFKTAKQWQSKQDTNKFVAVVVLDEVGLAEDSPNLPLKALHPLLEDGTEGASKKVYVDEIVQRDERVAFIGISNWALDPAKMNRGVMVTRGDPSEQELEFSAEGICSNEPNDPIKERLKEYFKPLAEAYTEICTRQLKEKQFFGLRDFYSLIKMLYWMCERSRSPPTWPQLQHAIMRNFGGLQSDKFDTLEIFEQKILINREPPDLTGISEELHPILNPDCSRLGLIRTSLSSREKTWHGENRYLLFLTENYAALDILKHYLSDVSLAHQTAEHQEMEPFILFGSSFPKDKEYTQVCRNINQIKICMETGRTVILLNLENLYESLYDALNQYYIHSFGNRYVDLGLQTHRVKCRVHDNFKLILIAEKDTVYDKFPTPLINRLEKHFVLTSSVLEDWQKKVLKDFEEWIDKFSKVRGKSFKPGDAFIGFQKDTPAAVVFQATNHLEKIKEKQFSFRQTMITESGILNPEELSDEDQESLSEAVLKLSQYLLLQTAAPDAVVRLESTPLAEEKVDVQQLYFKAQHHSSIEEFLNCHIHEPYVQNGLLIQITTHSHLLSHEEVREVEDKISMNISPFFLHEFDTELDFTNKLSPEFKRRQSDPESRLVIIQCDSGHLNADLIACARYRIYDVRARSDNKGITHVLFVIHLSHHQEKSLFVGFQGDPWLSVHIDDLRPTSENAITPQQAINSKISELFLGNRAPMEVVVPMEVLSGHEQEPESEHTLSDSEELEMEHESTAALVENEEMQVDEGSADDTSETSSIEVDRPEQEEFVPSITEQIHSSSLPSLPPQYRRLHGCIQAAASRLQDTAAKRRATKRVEILVNLIPKEPCLPLDNSSFLGILVTHIHKVLEERDQIWDQDEDWALKEALDPKKLHSGGTFRNVLARKIDEVIIPIFAEIIACVDHNYNLDLISFNNENSPICRFWLAMFRSPEVMQFSYKDMTVARKQVPGVGGRRSEDVFQCRLPFSWLIKKTIDAQWDNAKSTAGNNFKKLNEALYEAIQQTPVGEVLEVVSGTDCEEFYDYYLHDFVKMVHNCHHKKEDLNDIEYKLIANAVNVMVHNPDISSIDGRESLTKRIAAVHVVYMMNRSQIMWFGQLTTSEPGILLPLKIKEAPDSTEMVLHLHAVERTLDVLAPPLEKDATAEHLVPWLNRVRCSQNAISSIITLPSQSGSLSKIRLKWQLIRVMQLFLEHVLLKHDQVSVAYARRLELFLKSNSDFLKASTLTKVKKTLNLMDTELKTKHKLKQETTRNIKRSCRQFFMEVVSSLCFGGVTAPEPDLIKMLMEIVFSEKSDSGMDELETRDLTPYKVSSDRIPTIRSFLLQLLLEHNDQSVKEHLNEYFEKSLRATGKEVDHDLSLLCVQCFEDSLNKKVLSLSTEEKTERVVELLREGHDTLRHCTENSVTGSSLEYLEGIAQLRFALSVVAEALSQLHVHNVHTANILHTAREVCMDPVINSIDETGARGIVGPVVYLLKLLVRQFGLPCLQNAAEAYQWIIPECLKTTDEEEKLIDCFAIYNETGYSGMRECVSGAAYGKQLEDLLETTKGITVVEAAMLSLSFYQKVTLSRANTLPSKHILPDVLEGLDQSIVGSPALNQEMKWTARALIANQQGGPLAQLSVRPHQPMECRILSAIVVHAATVFSTMQRVEVLYPFVSMLTQPTNLLNAYLPTMQEDYLQEARRVMGGQFYACPRGHPYFVGECGRPVEERTCRTCGAAIGGVNHQLRRDNAQARTNDSTQTGHDLGNPSGRTSVPAPERNLSPPAVCIIRALMHSAFIWASCNNHTAVEGITQLVKPRIPPDSLQEFFWKHLEKDIEHLRMVTGKATDESALIVHLVLKEILTKPPPTTGTVSTVKTLGARNARQEWERVFNDHYVQPILESLDKSVGDAMNKILNDDNQDHDKLYYLVYERVKVDDHNLEPHLWSFRSRITLDHLGQTLQDAKMKKKHPILHEFLQAELNLRATQYLPDIVRLQQCLYDSFHHRLGRTDAMTQTIGEFLQGMKNENARNEYRERIESVQKAWSLVGQRLRTHTRLRVDDKYFIPMITNETPLQYLIPTTTEAGVCTTALVDFLTLTHNDFIEKCRAIVTKSQPSSVAFWREHKVPITHIHGCHLLDYEQHLLSIVLSHCQYSLKLGKGCEIKYDHQALEKHILDRFIHGKPMILSDIPQVVYRKDIYTTVYFAAIRKKVNPQEPLSARMKQEILAELRTPDLLRETLDVVDIVLGFLSSGGGKAGRSLGEYIDKVLKMKKRRFSKKARDYCKLSHILSLWEMISVELAKLLWLKEEEPFDSVKEDFLRDLSGKDSDDDQKLALDTCLRTHDLDRLLGILYEFIETYVKHSPERELEWPLADTLEAFLMESGLPEIPRLTETFPDTITLAQAVSTWKRIVIYQAVEKLK